MVLEICFVVFFILGVIGSVAPMPAPYNRGWSVLLWICVGILGWCIFNNTR
jgi:hypothetical protein